MPVFNTKKWLGEAVESILHQTFTDFEFIIVDDCSTDGSYELLQEYAQKDKRIKLYKNEKNSGVAFTKNRAIRLSTTDYLASQDSDDVSFTERLQMQYDFLEKNKDFAVVAGNNLIIDETGKQIGQRKYSDHIRAVILKKSPVSHPTTMIRKSHFLAVGGYANIPYVEDYDLRVKLFVKGYKIKNLSKNLLKYRIRKGQVKSEKVKGTIKGTLRVQSEAYHSLRPSLSDRIYHFCLQCLQLLPKQVILALFILLEYK